MDFRQLETFRMVATTGSFTRAAKALGYAQSSVTGQIQALERELGSAVFDRMSRRAVLTPAGERLMKYAGQILSLAAEARVSGAAAADGQEPEGEVSVTSPESLLSYRLLPAIRSFRDANPRVALRMRPGSTTVELRRQLMEGSVDVAFMYEEETDEASGIVVCKLKREPLVLVGRPGHRLAGREGVSWADVAGEPILFTQMGCAYRNLFERTLIRAGVPFGTGLELDAIDPIKRCVGAGMGISLLPAIAVRPEIDAGELAEIRIGPEPLWIWSMMLWHKNRWMSPAIRKFVESIRRDVGCERDGGGAPKPPARRRAAAASR
jgi:DNA-binding transcriptional LysR family regulator